MYGIQLVSHFLVRSGFDIARDKSYHQNRPILSILAFLKTSLKLSASTPPSYVVVFVLLGMYPRYVSYTAGVTFPNKVRFGHCM